VYFHKCKSGGSFVILAIGARKAKVLTRSPSAHIHPIHGLRSIAEADALEVSVAGTHLRPVPYASGRMLMAASFAAVATKAEPAESCVGSNGLARYGSQAGPNVDRTVPNSKSPQRFRRTAGILCRATIAHRCHREPARMPRGERRMAGRAHFP